MPTWRAARPPANCCSSRERQGRPKVAIVFGGSRGIGAAIASRLARDGFDVALTYVSRPDRASDLVSAIEDIGRRAIAVRADSADPAAIRNAVAETVERLGTLDVAVVNAGVLRLHWSRRSRSRIST